MSMEPIMGGLFLINGTDIWTEYGVFLTEEKRGGRDNLKAIPVSYTHLTLPTKHAV